MQMRTMRAFLPILAAENLGCGQCDINNALNTSGIKEMVFFKPPQRVKDTKGKSLRILHSLYGLEQSDRD